MPQAFEYRVRDRSGRLSSGTLEGDDVEAVARRLREMGLTPINVTRQSRGLRTEIVLRPGHVDLRDLAIFCRQFATMLTAGLPILRCIATLADQTDSRELAKVLRVVRTDVERGSSLTAAMQRHPKTFDDLLVAMVRTGETTGMLGDVMGELSSQIEAEVTLRGRVRSAMTYPVAVIGLVLAILAAMLLFVVPQFETIYSSLDAQLPLPTRILLTLSRGFQRWWWIVTLLGTAGGWWFGRWRRTPSGRARVDAAKLRLPVFGELFRKVAMARFATTLGILLRSGVPILQALDVVADAVDNAVVGAALGEVKDSVRRGESLAGPLARHDVFPAMVVQMAAVGEEAGSVDTMMGKVAEFYNDEVEATVSARTSLIEPILIGMMGIVVGGIVIALFMPILQLSSLVS